MDLSAARLADFAPCVGTEFRLLTEPANAIVIALIEVAPLSPRGNPRRPEPFSLIFRGPKDRPLEQRIHTLEHDRLGRLDLFLVPIGPPTDGEGACYQGIFN